MISKDGEPLPGILRDFKKFTAREIFQSINTVYESRREWMKRLFFESGEELRRITNYKIHYNPVVEEIVDEPEHYLYSSARDYATNRKGLLEIDFIRT